MNEGRWFALFRDNFDKLLLLFFIFSMCAYRTFHAPLISNDLTDMVVGGFMALVTRDSMKKSTGSDNPS